MPKTVEERLATLEAGVIEIRADVREVLDVVNGTGTVAYERSVRGRLHTIESTLAGMVLRRNFGVGFARGWVQAVFLLCGVATAAAAWYAVISGA